MKFDRFVDPNVWRVMLDSQMTWSVHIHLVRSKVSKFIGVLCKAKKILNLPILLTLYYSFIYPHFIYCIESGIFHLITGASTNKNKRAVRLMKLVSAHSAPLFHSLKLLPLCNIL